MKHFVTLVILFLFTGCAGNLYTYVDPKPDHHGRIKGVIVYQPRTLVLEYQTTHFQDESGKIAGSSDEGKCIPIPSYEIIDAPNYGKMHTIYYDASPLETKKFSVELEKGILTKVNSESTSAAKEALDVVQGIIGTAKEIAGTIPKVRQPPAGQIPACNIGKKVVGLRNIEEILKEGIPQKDPKHDPKQGAGN
jgi:hypothetical protein